MLQDQLDEAFNLGRKRGKLDVAENLVAQGLETHEISLLTDFSLEEIKALNYKISH